MFDEFSERLHSLPAPFPSSGRTSALSFVSKGPAMLSEDKFLYLRSGAEPLPRPAASWQENGQKLFGIPAWM